MVDSMKKVAKLDVELTVEERNLLSVAYKNVIGARRASWRILSSLEEKVSAKSSDHKSEDVLGCTRQVIIFHNHNFLFYIVLHIVM